MERGIKVVAYCDTPLFILVGIEFSKTKRQMVGFYTTKEERYGT